MKKFQSLGRSLSKNEMKAIRGGSDVAAFAVSDGGYKCCWANDMSNCSDCVPAAEPKCVGGAKAVSC